MESLTIAIDAVLPVCILIIIGYLIKEKRWLSNTALLEMNKLIFNLFLPITLMASIITADIQTAVQPKLLLYCIFSLALIIIYGIGIVHFLEKDPRKKGVIIQAIFRSNFTLLGLPIIQTICVNQNLGVTSVMIAFLIPLQTILSVLILQLYSKSKVNFKNLFLNILKNPMIIGAIIGFVILITNLQLPSFASKIVNDLAKVTTPLALIVLGGTFEFKAIKNNIKTLVFVGINRLIIVPLIFVGIAIALGYRNVELASLLIFFGAPTAVASFAMAQAMDGDSELAAQIVLTTTMFSAITIFCWIFILNMMRMI